MDGDLSTGLLLSPNFHNYGDIIADEFETRGVEMTHLPYPEPDEFILKRLYYHIVRNIKYRTQPEQIPYLKIKRHKRLIDSYNEVVWEKIDALRPDFILVIKGSFVQPDTVRKIRDETETVPILWCYDEIRNLPHARESVPFYHNVYSYKPPIPGEFEGSDRIAYLPLAHDHRTYNPIDTDVKSSIDVSFVGGTTDSRRREILSHLASSSAGQIEVWFSAWSWSNPASIYRYKIKNRSLESRIHNTTVDHSTVNEIYNRSKICLNIHKSWKIGSDEPVGLNMRTFEILGAGGFQLVDDVSTINNHFTPGTDLVTYTDMSDLAEKISYFLDDSEARETISRNGNKQVKSEHTFSHRIDTLLNQIRESVVTS